MERNDMVQATRWIGIGSRSFSTWYAVIMYALVTAGIVSGLWAAWNMQWAMLAPPLLPVQVMFVFLGMFALRGFVVQGLVLLLRPELLGERLFEPLRRQVHHPRIEGAGLLWAGSVLTICAAAGVLDQPRPGSSGFFGLHDALLVNMPAYSLYGWRLTILTQLLLWGLLLLLMGPAVVLWVRARRHKAGPYHPA